MRPLLEVAHILEEHLETYGSQHRLSAHQLATLRAIECCRTARLGGHVDVCDACGYVRISYNSCRNRHCPKCQTTNRERWIQAREQDLLPIPYFHLVFTLPAGLNELCLKEPRQLYALLFQAAWSTVHRFASDPKHLGAQTGMIAILHTWGQTLCLHPHLHCIVMGGGLTRQGKWKVARSQGKYLFPVKALSQVFRARLVALLREWLAGSARKVAPTLFRELFTQPWVVYCKQPFLGPRQVIEYLGRYTHKVAISNHRLLGMSEGQVTFTYKDYRLEGKQKQMRLSASEFIRRFCLHILPKGLVRIRHFGLLAAKNKAAQLAKARMELAALPPQQAPADWKTICKNKLGFDADLCPCCQKGTLREVLRFAACHSPPTPEEVRQSVTCGSRG